MKPTIPIASLSSLALFAVAPQPTFAQDAASQLPEISVVGRSESRTYYDGEGSVARSETPLRELPQSVRVIPRQIIDDILAGMADANPIHPVHVEPDRARAIFEAIGNARQGDVVLIAGKGHEDYQEIAGDRLPFSDLAVAKKALEAWA